MSRKIGLFPVEHLAKATEDELRGFVGALDAMPDSRKRSALKAAFDRECDRRAYDDAISRNGGEWI